MGEAPDCDTLCRSRYQFTAPRSTAGMHAVRDDGG